jgi:heme exporter protein D
MDWSKFFSMGGYAFYVWGSYAVALVSISAELLFLAKKRKSLDQARRDLQSRGDLNNETPS